VHVRLLTFLLSASDGDGLFPPRPVRSQHRPRASPETVEKRWVSG